MDLRRLGDSILKSRPSPFLLFLTPSVSTPRFSVVAGNPQDLALFNLIHPQKSSFSIHRPVSQASAAAVALPSSPESDSNESTSRPLVDPRGDAKRQEVGNLLEEAGIHSASSSNISSTVAATKKTVNRPISSFETVRSAFSNENFYSRRPVNRPGGIHNNMQFPDQPRSGGEQDGASLQTRQTAQSVKVTNLRPRAVRTIESSPSVGRTVELNPNRGVDLARALRQLRFECTKNNVLKDQFRQRFHERPGIKRKRLKRERWRVRFNQGFRAMVQKVLAMRRKGW